jgi:hypothetical protein
MALRFERVPVSAIAIAFCLGPTFFSRAGRSFILTMRISGRPSPSRSPVAKPREGRAGAKPGPADAVTSVNQPLP